MSYWVFPAGGVAETVTCVLSPDDVMGEAACMEVGRQANTNEKAKQSKEIDRLSVAGCLFNYGLPPGTGRFTS